MSFELAKAITEQHALELANRTDEEWWASIEDSFNMWRDIFEMRLETEKDAIGKKVTITQRLSKHKVKTFDAWRRTTPVFKHEDPEDGFDDWHIPYNASLNQGDVREAYENGKELLPIIREAIQKRELTFKFLFNWGWFQSCVEALRLVIDSGTYAESSRAGAAGPPRRTRAKMHPAHSGGSVFQRRSRVDV